MRHSVIWKGIDTLAEKHGLSASGLAKKAGLDATAFNKSKRLQPDGSPRWLSTESLIKALDAVGASLEDFAALAEGRRGHSAPLLGFAKAGNDGYFDDAGFPVGDGWEEVRFPGLETEDVYALEITGDSMEPVYRRGDRIVVAPAMTVRKGDRVVARTKDGEVLAKVLGRMTERTVELLSLNPAYPPRELSRAQLAWMARILWASQ
ncbi:MAG TPA: helix-turn-helix transcriptional regulator [Hyphomonadaceae bacterium]|jgi:phage repressor protein C with HTH and peptisase S24 domain|nr:helix-turn-helix transcriptional regulator [Hyphomonadaceae bacterium]